MSGLAPLAGPPSYLPPDVKLVTASEGALANPDTAVSEAFTPK